MVEHAEDAFVLLRADDALFAISAFPMVDPTVSVNVIGHLYRAEATSIAGREERRWRDRLTTVPTPPTG